MNGIKIRDYLFRYDDYFNLSATFNYFKSIYSSIFFFRSTKVFNANLCHFASRSPRFPIILRLTYGTRLRTNRLRHVSFFSFHREKKFGLFKYELSLSIHPSFSFFIFFSFTSIVNFYDLTSCARSLCRSTCECSSDFFFEF